MENDEKERKIMKKQRKILENEENVRKNEGKPMKNQGKVKEKVRKPCPRPKKNKIPKTRKKNSPKNSAPKLKCPVPKNYWFLPRSIQKRQQLDDFWGALQEPLDVWNGCREAQHGQTASASTPFPAPLEVEIM